MVEPAPAELCLGADGDTSNARLVTGVIFNSTRCPTFAMLDVAVQQQPEPSADSQQEFSCFSHTVIMYAPPVSPKEWLRELFKSLKVGDAICAEGLWEKDDRKWAGLRPDWRVRAVCAPACVQMRSMDDCTVQRLRLHFLGPPKQRTKKQQGTKRGSSQVNCSDAGNNDTQAHAHGSKTPVQERTTKFVQFVISQMNGDIARLNQGTGVVDVAGGSGHLSLAFALAGVQSTVVDPRDTCGMLPRRDRKAYQKAIRKREEAPFVVEFKRHCAWFGGRLAGADSAFSGGANDPDKIPSCGGPNDDSFSRALMEGCSAIVAMHPDEATEAAVDWALQHQRPFFVVPCCVFGRLFPHRRLADGRPVASTSQFVKYLMEKNFSIKVQTLDFDGANQCVFYAGSYP